MADFMNDVQCPVREDAVPPSRDNPGNEKPVGVESFFSVCSARIETLLLALFRYIALAETDSLDRDGIALMKGWARELSGLLDMYDTELIYAEP